MNLSIDIARRILEASKQRANELRSPVSIAIVDAGGHLVLFERMMSPYGWATGSISIAKASTAVMFNQSTDAVAQWGSGIPGFASSMATMTQGKFIMAAGGWPIRIGGATIGGIGVSGGNAPGRDDEIARAGLGTLEAIAPAIPSAVPQPQPSLRSNPSIQPTPNYPSMPIPQSQAQQLVGGQFVSSGSSGDRGGANELNYPSQAPQNVPNSTHYLSSDPALGRLANEAEGHWTSSSTQARRVEDDQLPLDQHNETLGG